MSELQPQLTALAAYPTLERVLRFGEASQDSNSPWPDYVNLLDLGPDDVAPLIALAIDTRFYDLPAECPEVWAPLHAWRALGQLRAAAAVGPLLAFVAHDKKGMEDDTLFGELPIVIGMIGPSALEPMRRFVGECSSMPWTAGALCTGCEAIVKAFPQFRDDAVGFLVELLQNHAKNDATFNSFVVSSLIHLRVLEAIDLIRDVYAADNVDPSIAGDIEDVEIALDLRDKRTIPRLRATLFGARDTFGGEPRATAGPLVPVAQRGPDGRKIGRNDPCLCGSGKKYKKCCGR